jgi:hypothetical protein
MAYNVYAKSLQAVFVVSICLKLLSDPARDFSATGIRKPSETTKIGYWHNTWCHWYIDVLFCAFINKLNVKKIRVEILSDFGLIIDVV